MFDDPYDEDGEIIQETKGALKDLTHEVGCGTFAIFVALIILVIVTSIAIQNIADNVKEIGGELRLIRMEIEKSQNTTAPKTPNLEPGTKTRPKGE